MATSYADIIAAIDAAVLSWAGQPVRVKDEYNREIEYRSLDELMRARAQYVQLQVSSSGQRGFALQTIQPGDAK